MYGQTKREERVRDVEDLLGDPFYTQIPTNPNKEDIIEILSKNPAIISYIGNIITTEEEKVSMKKLILEKKKREYNNLISESRINLIETYREELKEHLIGEPQAIKDLAMETGCTAAQAREVVKMGRPDKPTTGDLNDRAEREHFEFYNDEVINFEKEIVESEKIIDDLKVKLKLYENNLRAATSIKGLIENDYRNH